MPRAACPRVHLLATTALLLGLVTVFAIPSASAQISPGKLSRFHEDLEGPLQCTKCHGRDEADLSRNCLSCHGEIRTLVKAQRGLHARVNDRPCGACHPEHAGHDFEIVAWEEGSPEKFDHRRAGWPLEGKHATLACRTCHQSRYQKPAFLKTMERKDPSHSWLGLETACAECHGDPHAGALGAECRSCHGLQAWAPASGFDHARSPYPLTGKHAAVACARCHAASGLDLPKDAKGQPKPRWKPLDHGECGACHRDPHASKFGAACSGCHTTESFSKVNRETFPHDRTRFPLRGRHVQVACAKCHDPQSASKNPPFERCGSCHRDPHAGRATLGGRSADCAACHGEAAFVPSTFTVDLHEKTPYPLQGKHREAACRGCHAKNPPGVPVDSLGAAGIQMHPRAGACRDCHEDAHAGQLAARPDGGACEACHTPEGWKPSRYTAEEHARLRLPLAGRHAEIACSACHGPERSGLPPLPDPSTLGKARVLLKFENVSCTGCHQDAHGRPFVSVSTGKPLDCASCHEAVSFHSASVDIARHAGFSYPLEGAHRAVLCVACHPELEHEPARSTLVASGAHVPSLPFSGKRAACRDCHRDAHDGQFEATRYPDCGSCHGLEGFGPAVRFDHDRDAAFPLRSGHEKVPCARCHPSRETPGGGSIVRYRPLDRTCRSCHAGPAPGRGDHP